jgi:hypothetical protein
MPAAAAAAVCCTFHPHTQLDSLSGTLHPSPEHLTSADNFLSDGLTFNNSSNSNNNSNSNNSRPASRCNNITPRSAAATAPNSARSSCPSRPVSRPASPEVAARARLALKGQLLPGSLLVEEEEEDEEAQQQREMQQRLMAAAMAAYDEAARKEEELIAMYPHGAPVGLGFRLLVVHSASSAVVLVLCLQLSCCICTEDGWMC